MFRGGEVTLFESKELDYMATKKRVERLIEKYEKCLMRIHTKAHPKITQTYTMEMPGSLGGFNSKTEDAVIYMMVDSEPDYKFVKQVSDCINRLGSPYREIIILSFFYECTNIQVAEKLNMSQRSMSLKKRIALELFAYGMGAEVFV